MLLASALVGSLEEVLGQRRQLVASLAQGLEPNHQGRQGEIELGPKLFALQGDLGIEGRGRQQPDRRVERCGQPLLKVARQHQNLADQEGRAIPQRQARPAPFRRPRTMVAALGAARSLDAEQLALQDLGRQGLAIERDQGLLASRPVLMNGSRDLSLSRTRLPHDEHRGCRRGGQTHLVEQPPVRRTEADQAVEPISLLEPPPDLE